MAEENSVTLQPLKYDKLGIIHCGVISEGRVAVAGDVRQIDDGSEITVDRARVKVKRNGNEYTFSKV